MGCPTKQRSRNQNGCAARSADKNVGVAGLEARSTRAMKSSRAAKNLTRCNTFSTLSCLAKARRGDRRRKSIVCPTERRHECVRHCEKSGFVKPKAACPTLL